MNLLRDDRLRTVREDQGKIAGSENEGGFLTADPNKMPVEIVIC